MEIVSSPCITIEAEISWYTWTVNGVTSVLISMNININMNLKKADLLYSFIGFFRNNIPAFMLVVGLIDPPGLFQTYDSMIFIM